MSSAQTRSFAEELKSIVEALSRASLIASSLGDVHEAELTEATSDWAVKNRELINLNKELQAQLGQVLPLPHPFICDESKSSASPEASKSPAAEGGSEASEKADDVSIEKVLDKNAGQDAKPSVSRGQVEKEGVDTELLPAPAAASTEDGSAFSLQPSGLDMSQCLSNKSCLDDEDVGDAGMALANSSKSEHGFDATASMRAMGTGRTFTRIPVALRPCWRNGNVACLQSANDKFSVKVKYSTVARSESMGLRMLASSASTKGGVAGFLVLASLLHCQVMHPVGQFRMFWNGLCLMYIGYDLLIVPLQVFDVDNVKALHIFEWMLTIWWTLDVLMTFRTGYFVGSRVEMRPRQIARHYMRTWLFCDVLIVALEWVNRFAAMVGSASLMRSSRALRTLRFMKLLRLTKAGVFWKALQEQVNSNVLHLFMTISILCGILLFTVHFVSCAWYALGTSRDDGWVSYDEYSGEKGVIFWYVASIRWVISQFNGRTDMDKKRNMQERLFTCIVGVTLAVLAHAVFISVITKTMLDLSELVSEKTRRRRFVNEYLELNPLPPVLTSQVKRCLVEYHDVGQEAAKEAKVLSILPQHVQAEVLYEVRSPVLMENSFFYGLRHESPWAMRFICRKVVDPVSASKYEVVFDKGDVCSRMLFMNKLTATYGEPYENRDANQTRLDSILGMAYTGDLEKSSSTWRLGYKRKNFEAERSVLHFVKSVHGHEVKTVSEGAWVSEAAVWSEWRNQGRLLSNGHGFLLAIQATELAKALNKHPDAYALAFMYGSKLAEELNKQPEPSDVLPFDVKLVAPIKVSVNIISASGLYNADNFLQGKSDPYCVCNVCGMASARDCRFKTDIIYDSLDPVWNHRAEVGLTRHQTLEFQVFDYDFGKQDTELGTARLYPDDFYPNGFNGDLELTGARGRAQGSIKVSVDFLECDNEVPALRLSVGRRLSKSRASSKQSTESFMKVLA